MRSSVLVGLSVAASLWALPSATCVLREGLTQTTMITAMMRRVSGTQPEATAQTLVLRVEDLPPIGQATMGLESVSKLTSDRGPGTVVPRLRRLSKDLTIGSPLA